MLGVQVYYCDARKHPQIASKHLPIGLVENYIDNVFEMQTSECKFCFRAIQRVRETTMSDGAYGDWATSGPSDYVIQEEP